MVAVWSVIMTFTLITVWLAEQANDCSGKATATKVQMMGLRNSPKMMVLPCSVVHLSISKPEDFVLSKDGALKFGSLSWCTHFHFYVKICIC